MRKVSLLILLVSCAHKALPPAPDFYPPELDRIIVRDQNHLSMRFSEPIDTSSLDSLRIEGLGVITGHIIGPELYLLTEPMEDRNYQFTIIARDRSQNRRLIRGRFKGTTRRDTFPPALVETRPIPFATGASRLLRGEVRFNEELDTILTPMIYLQPGTSRVEMGWRKDLVRLWFAFPETLQKEEVYYLLIYGPIRDIAQNQALIAQAFPFTPDTILPLYEHRGRVEPACTAIIVGRTDHIIGFAINLPAPGFTIYLPESVGVSIEAFAPTRSLHGTGSLTDTVIFLKPNPLLDLDRFLR